MCTGTGSTGSESEEIKLDENLLYWENRVGAGKVPMSVIDVTQSVFGPGLVGFSTDMRMVMEMLRVQQHLKSFRFCQGSSMGDGLGVMDGC